MDSGGPMAVASWREVAEAGRPASRLGIGWEGPALLGLTVALLSFGLVMVYSASAVMAQTGGLEDYYFVVRQAAGGALGLVALAVLARVDYRWLRRLAWPLLGGTALLLVIVVLPVTHAIAPEINGARRWLMLGPLALQPSEFAKLSLVVWTAALAVKKQERLSSLSRGLLPFLVVWAAVDGLIVLQPSLSSALLVLLLAALVVFAAGARIGHFLVLAVVGLPVLWGQVEAVAYRMRRVVAFLDPTQDPAGMSYQINQALIAVGSGGVLGRGFGRGEQKFGFLPEPHNDFIFAIIGEEWGFLGVLALVTLFATFALVGYRVARQAPDLFGCLLAVGLTNLIVVQALLHMAVNLALVPTTGVTLPFISYGRSSLLVCLAAVGVLLSIARAGAAAASGSATAAGGGG
ncbi:MAG TPA: putative lipid II flippase FtsW [Longimicrobiales bacterium]